MKRGADVSNSRKMFAPRYVHLHQCTVVEQLREGVSPMFQSEPDGVLRFSSQDLWPSTNTTGTHSALAIEQLIVATAVFS